MSELDDLRATVAALEARVRSLEDHVEITQLVAQYGPSVDSGSAEATANLWTEDGTFDAVGAIEMRGRDEIAGMMLVAPCPEQKSSGWRLISMMSACLVTA